MILPIYTYGQPVLRKETEEIGPDYPNLKEIIQDMWDTLAKSRGVGLAAPQVGLSIRMAIIDLDCISEDEPQYAGYKRTFINPYIEEVDETEEAEEIRPQGSQPQCAHHFGAVDRVVLHPHALEFLILMRIFRSMMSGLMAFLLVLCSTNLTILMVLFIQTISRGCVVSLWLPN